MHARRLRRWQWVHRWSSLVCTVFLLVLCLTGLPLVFRDELADWASASAGKAAPPAQAGQADLDAMVDAARGPSGLYPGQTVRWISLEDDRPEMWIALAPTYLADRKLNHVLKFDAHTGRMLPAASQAAPGRPTLTGVLLRLHKDLLLGLPGELFLGAMALLVLLASVSGAVLYSPYLRNLDFGTVRRQRGARIRWLDIHNLLGITTLAWVLVVGATGAMNEVADPLYDRWRETALADALRPLPMHCGPTTGSRCPHNSPRRRPR
ncbi:PepSY-associated TM helix domain-containing protein [Variovorax sp. H27-G14]|uniref:PepSY-associated TM helix domain-containing protein n=1 Tax=Variovorax sp. H27-G14 TaxID=3111914 RepID=UPI0038FBE512